MRQLDLFDAGGFAADHEAQSTADILCFPLARNVGKVRHVAGKLAGRATKRARDSYWTQVINSTAGALVRAGVDNQEIERQLRGFYNAVNYEMSILRVKGEMPSRPLEGGDGHAG